MLFTVFDVCQVAEKPETFYYFCSYSFYIGKLNRKCFRLLPNKHINQFGIFSNHTLTCFAFAIGFGNSKVSTKYNWKKKSQTRTETKCRQLKSKRTNLWLHDGRIVGGPSNKGIHWTGKVNLRGTHTHTHAELQRQSGAEVPYCGTNTIQIKWGEHLNGFCFKVQIRFCLDLHLCIFLLFAYLLFAFCICSLRILCIFLIYIALFALTTLLVVLAVVQLLALSPIRSNKAIGSRLIS